MADNAGEKKKLSRRASIYTDLQLIAFIILHVLIIGVLFNTVYTTEYGSTGLYYQYAGYVLDGYIPYADFDYEYPPLSLIFILLPGLFASSYMQYAVIYTAEIIIADLIAVYLIHLIASENGRSHWKMLAIYTVCLLALGPIVALQYDIFPAVIVLSSIYFFYHHKYKLSWGLLAVGAMTKLFPAVLMPVYLICHLKNRQLKESGYGILTFMIISVLAVMPFVLSGGCSIVNMIEYHAERGIQLESLYSAVLMIANQLGLTEIEIVFNHGAYHLAGSASDIAADTSVFIMIICLLIVYFVIYKGTTKRDFRIDQLGMYALMVLAALLAVSKVLSPQYLIWVFPLFALLSGRWRFMLTALFVMIGIMTYWIFPHNYTDLVRMQPAAVTVLIIRNMLLVFVAVTCVLALRRKDMIEGRKET
jgi:hypothetical protein